MRLPTSRSSWLRIYCNTARSLSAGGFEAQGLPRALIEPQHRVSLSRIKVHASNLANLILRRSSRELRCPFLLLMAARTP